MSDSSWMAWPKPGQRRGSGQVAGQRTTIPPWPDFPAPPIERTPSTDGADSTGTPRAVFDTANGPAGQLHTREGKNDPAGGAEGNTYLFHIDMVCPDKNDPEQVVTYQCSLLAEPGALVHLLQQEGVTATLVYLHIRDNAGERVIQQVHQILQGADEEGRHALAFQFTGQEGYFSLTDQEEWVLSDWEPVWSRCIAVEPYR